MLEEQLAGLRLGMFVYYPMQLADFYFSGCFQWLSTPLSAPLAARRHCRERGEQDRGFYNLSLSTCSCVIALLPSGCFVS